MASSCAVTKTSESFDIIYSTRNVIRHEIIVCTETSDRVWLTTFSTRHRADPFENTATGGNVIFRVQSPHDETRTDRGRSTSELATRRYARNNIATSFFTRI